MKLQNAAKGHVNYFENEAYEQKKINKMNDLHKPLIDYWKSILGTKIENVHTTNRLIDDP